MKHILVGLLVLLFALPAMAGPVISKPAIRQPSPVSVGPIALAPCGVESETINKIIPDALCCQTSGEARLMCLKRNLYSIVAVVDYALKISNDACGSSTCSLYVDHCQIPVYWEGTSAEIPDIAVRIADVVTCINKEDKVFLETAEPRLDRVIKDHCQ